MTFETSTDKIQHAHPRSLCIGAVCAYRQQNALCQPQMSASSVNTALQNGGNSNQSALFTFKLRTLHL